MERPAIDGRTRPHQPPEDADDVSSDWEAHAIDALRVRNQGLAIFAVGILAAVIIWNAWAPKPFVDNQVLTSTLRLDLNRATAAELNLLPGVGPKLIQAILERREALGGFQRLDQLMSIPGIKEGKLNAMAPFLYVDPIQTPSVPPAAGALEH
jgi:competence protein ComEA